MRSVERRTPGSRPAVLALLIAAFLAACSDDDAPEPDEAVCDVVIEIGDDYFSDSGPDNPLAKLAEAAGEESEIARLAPEMRDLSEQDQRSNEVADRFAELGRQLDDELKTACPDLAQRIDG